MQINNTNGAIKKKIINNYLILYILLANSVKINIQNCRKMINTFILNKNRFDFNNKKEANQSKNWYIKWYN